MARALWKGAINFGLVHIPVALWKATRPHDIHFRMLHETDLVPLKQKKVCPADDKEVRPEDIVRGYEVSKGEFVPVEDKDLEALQPENSHSIDIEDFVTVAEVDPIFYETAYYLSPEKGAAKPYSLLIAAMEKSGKAAVARFVLRSKQHLVIMRPIESGLGISTLYFADEVVPMEDIPGIPKAAKPAKQELDMAVRLIDSMSRPFDPENYKDTYRDEVMAMIKQKAKGIKPAKPKATKPEAKVIDLVSALQASLGEKSKPAAKPKKKAAAKKPAKKKSAA